MPVFHVFTKLGSHAFWRKLHDLHRKRLRLELRNTLPREFWSAVTWVTWLALCSTILGSPYYLGWGMRGEGRGKGIECTAWRRVLFGKMSMYTIKDYTTLWDSPDLLGAAQFWKCGGWEIQCRLYMLLLSI